MLQSRYHFLLVEFVADAVLASRLAIDSIAWTAHEDHLPDPNPKKDPPFLKKNPCAQQRYRAEIYARGKRVHIGYFPDEVRPTLWAYCASSSQFCDASFILCRPLPLVRMLPPTHLLDHGRYEVRRIRCAHGPPREFPRELQRQGARRPSRHTHGVVYDP